MNAPNKTVSALFEPAEWNEVPGFSFEDVTYHRCHASADDLTRRVADFEVRLNRDPFVIADRLWVKDQLDPEEEKLRFSN